MRCVSRRRERSAEQMGSATAQRSSRQPCDSVVSGTDSTRVAVIGSHRANHRPQDRELECFQPMLVGAQVCHYLPEIFSRPLLCILPSSLCHMGLYLRTESSRKLTFVVHISEDIHMPEKY